jgi:hypothetical protein
LEVFEHTDGGAAAVCLRIIRIRLLLRLIMRILPLPSLSLRLPLMKMVRTSLRC